MKNLFYKSLLVAICLAVSTPAFAIPVVDGFLDVDEYSNSFTTGWYNGHNVDGSKFKIDDDYTTTVYWEKTGDDENPGSFFLYMEAPLEAKNMIWGTGFTEDEALSYYQHWCSPNDGKTAALDGSNCAHHHNGFYVFYDEFSKTKTDFPGMTGSEKVIFGGGLVGNLAGGLGGTKGIRDVLLYSIIDYKDSVDYVINNLGCDRTNCNASSIQMAFEFEFSYLTDSDINSFISSIQDNELEFHMSPERGAAPVPEPSTMLLLGSGLAGMVLYRRKTGRR